MTTGEVIRRVEQECDLPDSWTAFEIGPIGNVEISAFDGEGMEDAALELINGRTIVEVVLQHASMPGLASAQTKGGLDELDEPATEIPSQVGVLQFKNLDDALEAVTHLADPDVLAEITQYRSSLETDDPLTVRQAVAKATDIDMSTVEDTLTSI